MPKKDFSFHYDIKTKTGKMIVGEKYIELNPKAEPTIEEEIKTSFNVSSSGGLGYGLNLI